MKFRNSKPSGFSRSQWSVSGRPRVQIRLTETEARRYLGEIAESAAGRDVAFRVARAILSKSTAATSRGFAVDGVFDARGNRLPWPGDYRQIVDR